MEALISAVLGDIISRAISMVVEKSRRQTTTEEDLQRLHQLLLRISTVVEEAEGRCVSNRGMILLDPMDQLIRQISVMKKQMFRGYYLLDSFKCIEKKTNDEEVSRSSFAPSKFNPAKRFRLVSSSPQIESMVIGRDNIKELKQVILVLENMVADMKEFAIFLMSYPRMYRQPCGAYLYLDKYMFGRQMEREQAISFLLQAEPLGGGTLGVLPVVGPGLIGKSTLVEHVCDDERVRNHFSLILRYKGNDLKGETGTTFRDNCVIKHQNIASGEERSLVVIELLGDVDEGAWKRLLQTSERYMAHGSKIIITNQKATTEHLQAESAILLVRTPEKFLFMEALISAVLGDITSRAISIMVEKSRRQSTAEEDLQRLQRLLLRISTVVEEAEGRCISNRGMIRQISIMIKQIFRGYYILDSFKCIEKKTNDEEVSRSSFSPSKFNPAKRFRLHSSSIQIESMVIGRDNSKELK
ncbi:hypothetical protein ACQ4PT_024473 [Festuca glaucescens]